MLQANRGQQSWQYRQITRW